MKAITWRELESLSTKAKGEARRRAHLNVHPELDDPVQRLFIALEPDTYIRPHRHAEPPRFEFFVLVRGTVEALTFDDNGAITDRVRMTAGKATAVEIPPATWHSYLCLESGTVVLEVKEGPYTASTPDNFADWSPQDDPIEIAAFMQAMRDEISPA
jgi:cupin fold WbuC family metalloprotein